MHIKIEQIEEGPNIVVCGDASGWFAGRLAKPNWQTCSAIYYILGTETLVISGKCGHGFHKHKQSST